MGCISKIFPHVYSLHPQGRGSALLISASRGWLTTRQCSLYATDCVLARLLNEPLSLGFDAGISPGPRRYTEGLRRQSATEQGLDPTPTGLAPASLIQLGWTHSPDPQITGENCLPDRLFDQEVIDTINVIFDGAPPTPPGLGVGGPSAIPSRSAPPTPPGLGVGGPGAILPALPPNSPGIGGWGAERNPFPLCATELPRDWGLGEPSAFLPALRHRLPRIGGWGAERNPFPLCATDSPRIGGWGAERNPFPLCATDSPGLTVLYLCSRKHALINPTTRGCRAAHGRFGHCLNDMACRDGKQGDIAYHAGAESR